MSEALTSPAGSPYALARSHIESARRSHLSSSSSSSSSSSASSSSSIPSSSIHDEIEYGKQVEIWSLRLLSTSPYRETLLSGPGGEELIKLAAQCQHLERFCNPRSDMPEGKAGYLKWRRQLYVIQAERAVKYLSSAGVSKEETDLVYKWVSKTDLQPGREDKGDPGTQLLEDAAVMVFLQEQLAGFAEKHQEYTKEKMMDILKKTWRKLSPNAKEAAKTISMDDSLRKIVLEATGQLDAQEQDEMKAST